MKHVQAKKDTERRNFFRIDDVAILHYSTISEEEMGDGQHDEDQLLIDKLTLKARFDSISRELQPLFRVIEAGSPEIAHYLASIDKKLNLLSEYYVDMAMGDMDMMPQKVNLGAGGISFLSSTPIMSGSMLEIRLVLLPDHQGVFTHAKVISCVRNCNDVADNHSYRISVEFKRMSDDVRDTITRHVLNKEQQSISKV
jgi:hypothetical protein